MNDNDIFTNTFITRKPWNMGKKGKIESWSFKVRYIRESNRERGIIFKSDPIYQPKNTYINKTSAEEGNFY
jgi:hypothetical protein